MTNTAAQPTGLHPHTLLCYIPPAPHPQRWMGQKPASTHHNVVAGGGSWALGGEGGGSGYLRSKKDHLLYPGTSSRGAGPSEDYRRPSETLGLSPRESSRVPRSSFRGPSESLSDSRGRSECPWGGPRGHSGDPRGPSGAKYIKTVGF